MPNWLPNAEILSGVGHACRAQTDETIYVIAHRDGLFDAAGDNASGVASMLGLAEYFAKIPKSQRRRTMVFIGTDGHHNIKPGGFGSEWLVANRDKFFSKTALMINAEHPAEVLTHGGAAGSDEPRRSRWNGMPAARRGRNWRKSRSTPSTNSACRSGHEPSERPPGGDLGRFYWFLPGRGGAVQRFHQHAHRPRTRPTMCHGPGWKRSRAPMPRSSTRSTNLAERLQRPATADPNAPASPQGYLSLANCEAWIQNSARRIAGNKRRLT